MTYRQLRSKIEALGCQHVRNARGSHQIWTNPANGRSSPVPLHGNRDIPEGTISAIRRNLGISRADFDRA